MSEALADFTILEQIVEPPEARLVLFIPESAPCFRGHFPGLPVMPGVVQIHSAVRLAHDLLNVSDRVAGLEVLKFRRTVPPESMLSLNLRFSQETNKLYFDFSLGTEKVSSGRIVLR